ncbi:MAG: hypothetical protein OEU44_04660, partial [Gammaproteobacteria bacterium]|nr:hypothetical protein [Gammaproteobacteria bacterium]
LSKAVSPTEEHVASGVMDDKGKHTAQLVCAFGPVFLPEMNKYLAIALRPENMPSFLQGLPQLFEVVYFTVAYGYHGFVFIVERLCPTLEVDDG